MRQRRRKPTRYIPSTNNPCDIFEHGGTGYQSNESSPLLDISNDIERHSDDWPIDPDGNSVILSNSFLDRLHLQHPFGKPKRLVLELFIMVNMG